MRTYPIHPAAEAMPMLSAQEVQALADDIKANGLQVPITVCQGQIIDGRNRLRACELAGVPPIYETRDDIDDVPMWVWSLNGERRHLSSQEQKVLIWKQLHGMSEKIQAEKRRIAEEANRKRAEAMTGVAYAPKGESRQKPTDKVVVQSGPAPSVDATKPAAEHKTRAAVAEAAKVNKTAVARAEALERKAPELAGKVAKGEMTFAEAAKKANVHVANNSGENEWYTPADYIDAARRVMGTIDVDPASNDIAQRTVMAGTYYTAETNGLDKEWSGCVWMNPPYAADLIKQFIAKLRLEYESGRCTEAIVLVNNATESAWFQEAVCVAAAVGFTRRRVRFLDPNGKPGAPLQGQALIYLGERSHRFCSEFADLCWCALIAGNG